MHLFGVPLLDVSTCIVLVATPVLFLRQTLWRQTLSATEETATPSPASTARGFFVVQSATCLRPNPQQPLQSKALTCRSQARSARESQVHIQKSLGLIKRVSHHDHDHRVAGFDCPLQTRPHLRPRHIALLYGHVSLPKKMHE